MKRIYLGLSLLASACASTNDGPADDCQPGDIDCAAPASGGGKADGFDYKNDPARMSQHLTYDLSKLPKKGFRDTPVWKSTYPEAVGKAESIWADTYWPTSEGSHNNRWQGANVKSPLEKYDAAFNNAPGCATYPSSFYGAGAKAAWDTYNNCAGPAAKWQTQEFQGGGQMHDGIDNDGDGKVDDVGTDGTVDGIAGWWGTCHAWTPASQLVPEPQHAVTMNGVRFEVGDIKAIGQNSFDSTSAVMLGGRCNSKEITHDVHGSANDDCADVNPGALHVVMTNFLGLTTLPLIEDRTANYEVWNQPVAGYEITQQNEVSASKANQCVGASGSTWTFNTKAKKLYDVRMTVTYVVEGYPGTSPIGFHNNESTDDYHYILEVSSAGKVIGGRYCTDTQNNHVDFLWSPTGTWGSPSNPYVDVANVKKLVKLAVGPDDNGGGGGGATKDFSVTPGTQIPDNDPAGVNVDVPVSGVTSPKGLAVSVDITHTYRGDLVLTLRKDGHDVKTLVMNQGGSTDNIVDTYTLSAAELGSSVNGTWTLNVSDTAAQDVGTVNKVTLQFSL
ncbi:MAG: proprotein convertase P-domain-containing protein [Deltaproteobacteria bacterium]|nr:proprotein convertase P-domain-containing protein [Deltaproteobacteria bacterium]